VESRSSGIGLFVLPVLRLLTGDLGEVKEEVRAAFSFVVRTVSS
jgi:hypothetical protein